MALTTDCSQASFDHPLVYSEPLVENWESIYGLYNCYVFSIGIPEYVYKNPGYFSNKSFSLAYDLPGIADLVKTDLVNLKHNNIRVSEQLDTSDLCLNEQVICFRKGAYDYHFMKLTPDDWYHKPGASVVLKYLSSPSNGTSWINEGLFVDGYFPGDTVYNSDILYIYYDGHDWEYTPNGNGTHVKSCSICGDVFSESCDLNYTPLGNDHHSVECRDCSYSVASEACSISFTYNIDKTHTRACALCSNSTTSNCTLTYTSIGSVRHTATCSICGNSNTEGCEWEYTTLSGGRHSYSCTKCDNSVSSEPCTYAYTANDDNTHTATCTLCSNSYDTDCGFTYEYSGDNSHHGVCGRCGNVKDEACAPESTYCGDGDQTHAHISICPKCDHVYGTGSTACTFAYKSNGDNTHVSACTQCRYVQSGPTACMFKSDNTCRFCGALKNSAVFNSQEEAFSES